MTTRRSLRAEQLIELVDRQITILARCPIGALKANCLELRAVLADVEAALNLAWDYLDRKPDDDRQFERFRSLLLAYERGHNRLNGQDCRGQ